MRLIIISNRLPITAEGKDGKFTFHPSSGGLATALETYLEHLKNSPGRFTDHIWIGWPGSFVADKDKRSLKHTMLSKFNCYPVYLSDVEVDRFYNGFCNDTLWPLFHYFPSYTTYNEEFWNYYKRANEVFFKASMEIIRPDDLVWIHDYHLMLLPALIRKKMQNITLGFFLHIPFPSFEIYRLLPNVWRRELLQGLLGNDLVGFHTHDYTDHFLRCALRILSLEHDLGKIHIDHRIVKVDTFPIGIDYEKFNHASEELPIREIIEGYRKLFADTKVILSMDRLDYTKGIINRLNGFEMFLERSFLWYGITAMPILSRAP